MVIEHVFVTTLESNDTIHRARQFLQAGGFESSLQGGFPMDAILTSLEMRRGKKNAGRAKTVSQLPQLVRLDWDRGRVTLALSIAANHVWGGGGFALTSGSGTPGNPKKMKLHTDLLMGIARGLEQLLVQQSPPDTASGEWRWAEEQIAIAAKKRTRRMWITFGVVMVLFIGVIVLIAMNA